LIVINTCIILGLIVLYGLSFKFLKKEILAHYKIVI
jgi:hypothetical protein